MGIVLVGILAAVAVVGIGRLTDQAAGASCRASADAALTAANTHLVGNSAYPTSLLELTTAVGGAAPLLVVPTGSVVSERTLVTDRWTLTMATGAPPTFTCGTTTTSGPTTTNGATTTTRAPSNDVTVAASTAGDEKNYGEAILTLTNAVPITDLTVTIAVAVTPGWTYASQYTTFWSGVVSNTHATAGGFIAYTFTSNAGQQIVAGTWKLDGQSNGTGTVHGRSGDTWTVTSTAAGVTTTLSGTFATAPAATVPTTTVGPTTTAGGTGITATPGTAGDQKYYGDHIVTLTNTTPITDLTVTISIAQTTGLTYAAQYTNFWSGTVATSHGTTVGAMTYTFTLNAGQQIVPGTWKLTAQSSGTGIVHSTSGDTWMVTGTSGGAPQTLTGTF